MAERQFDFDFTDDSIGTVRILAIPIAGGGGGGTVDSEMSDSSTNAVQNRVIKTYVDSQIISAEEFVYATFTASGSDNPYTITTAFTANNINSYLSEGKRLVLNGTLGGVAVQLPYVGKAGSNYYFGASANGIEYVISISSVLKVGFVNSVAYESDLSDVVSAEITLEAGSNIETYGKITVTDREGVDNTLTAAPVNTSTGKLYTANLPMKSTVTSGNTDPVNSVAVIAYAQPKTAVQTVSGTGAVTQALDPDKMYVFGTPSSLTITLTAAASDGKVHEYHFRFTSGSTATTLDLPATVTMPSGFTVEASKTYEISIIDNYGAYIAW